MYKYTFSHLDTIPECDRQTHRQTYDDDIYGASTALRGKNYLNSIQTLVQVQPTAC